MKYASSIRYGGMLVAAENCSYEAYRSLVLVCPCCHESVFLVAEHERSYSVQGELNCLENSHATSLNGGNLRTRVAPQRGVPPHGGFRKSAKVAAHFSHRADKQASEIKQCELRVTSLSASDITKSEAVAKNQRLRFFNRHLWNVLMMCHKLNDWEQAIAFLNKGFERVCNEEAALLFQAKYVDLIYQFITIQKEDIRAQANDFFENLILKTQDDRLVLHEDFQKILLLWRQQIDRRMHVEIYKEVIDCLLQKKHKPVLEKLIKVSLYNFAVVTALSRDLNLEGSDRVRVYNSFFSSEVHLSDKSVVGVFRALVNALLAKDQNGLSGVLHFVRDDILEIVALTPWTEGFEKYAS